MRIRLLAIGKTDAAYLNEAIALYEKRLKYYVPFEIQYIPDVKNAKSISVEQQKDKEGSAILSQLTNGEELVLLDEGGKVFTSVEFSEFLSKKMISSSKSLVFVIGGPYGFSQAVYEKASSKVSLSLMTFTHQMVRLLFVEQLYRAFTIIKGEPYHHM